MKNKKLDLLTEINFMREMMGLSTKTLLKENFGLTLLASLARSANKYSGMLAADIGRELGAVARATKPMFDDLARAITTGDQALAKATITNIVNTLDAPALARLADDILVNTGELATKIDELTKSLKGQGVADDIVKQTVKQKIDELFVDVPDALKSVLKNQSDTIINDAIKATTGKVTTISADRILSDLATTPVWQRFVQEFPDEAKLIKSRIETMIASGAKSQDEIYVELYRMAQNKFKPSTWAKWKNLFEGPEGILGKYGAKYGKASRRAVQFMFFLLLTGGASAWSPRIRKFFSEVWESDFDVFDWFSDDENAEPNNVTGGCDKTETDFISWSKSTFGDGGNPTFDESSCTGTVGGMSYKWNGTEWV